MLGKTWDQDIRIPRINRQNRLFGEFMLRWFKVVSAMVAMIALGLIAISCGNSGTHVRIVNAISNNQGIALDVYVNGAKINNTPLAFQQVYPLQKTPVTYVGVTSGSDTITAFNTGTTTGPVLGNGGVGNNLTGPEVSLGGGSYYTLLLDGSVQNANQPPGAVAFTDDNTLPTSGNVSFRVINASVYLSQQYPAGLEIFFEPNGASIPPGQTPQISNLTYGTASNYTVLPQQAAYSVYATPPGNPFTLIHYQYAQQNQQITTLVILDNANATFYYTNFLEMVDEN
jgi:uncharacterized protein DUF4397